MDKIILILLMALIQLSCTQRGYYDEAVISKNGKLKKTNLAISYNKDSLKQYFYSIKENGSQTEFSELYQITNISLAPNDTAYQYYFLSSHILNSVRFTQDGKVVYFITKTYDKNIASRFRLLMDSTFWNYQSPSHVTENFILDGGITKIEGIRNRTYKILEKTTPSKYDTSFNLQKGFFRTY